MSNLRQQFDMEKSQKEKVITEAALNWLEDNVIIINEKINRNSVNKLVSSIAKFESTFSPYETKVPTITSIIDGCEDNLQMVLMGKAGDKKTSEVLEYLSYVYNSFSSFFSRDLPVILKARLFKLAVENPDVRLDSLTSGGFDASAAQKAFAHGLTPSEDELKLVGKILKSKSIPKADAGKIASELMALSYNDLVELTSVGKVPLATTPKTIGEDDVIVTESMMHEYVSVLTEASNKEIGQKLSALKQIITKTGLQALTDPVNKLHSALLAYQGTPEGKQLAQHLSQKIDIKQLGNLFKTPGGKLTKQANMAIELFNSLGKAWPDIQELADKTDPTEQDVQSIKNILTKAVSGGLFKKAAQAAGIATPPYPGLEPAAVVDALTSSTLATEGLVREEEVPAATTGTAPNTNIAGQLAKLKTVMTALSQFSSGAASNKTAAATPTTASQTTAAQNQGSAETTSTKAAGTNGEKPLVTPTQETGGEDELAARAAMTALGSSKDSTKKQIKQVIAALKAGGYTITKVK